MKPFTLTLDKHELLVTSYNHTLFSKQMMRTLKLIINKAAILTHHQILPTDLQRNVSELKGRINNQVLAVKGLLYCDLMFTVVGFLCRLKEVICNTKF